VRGGRAAYEIEKERVDEKNMKMVAAEKSQTLAI
jgi:hypothetical protein